MRIADLIREGKMFIKNRTKVYACRMSDIERRVVYFRKLPLEIQVKTLKKTS